MEFAAEHQCNINEQAVQEAKRNMPAENDLIDLAELFKVFGDSTRIGILCALNLSSMYVCDLADLLGMSHSAISHQLRILRQAKLVSAIRQGKNMRYTLADDHVRGMLAQGLEHVKE